MRNQHLDTSHSSCTAPRTEENKTRRRADLPMDVYLDFDKPMLGLVWAKASNIPSRCSALILVGCALQDNETAAQVSLYPREDMQIRLSDHKVALAEVGLEQGNGDICVYAENVEHPGSRCWYKFRPQIQLIIRPACDYVSVQCLYMEIPVTAEGEENVPGRKCTFENSIEVGVPFALRQRSGTFSLGSHKPASLRNHLVEFDPFCAPVGDVIDNVHLPHADSAFVAGLGKIGALPEKATTRISVLTKSLTFQGVNTQARGHFQFNKTCCHVSEFLSANYRRTYGVFCVPASYCDSKKNHHGGGQPPFDAWRARDRKPRSSSRSRVFARRSRSLRLGRALDTRQERGLPEHQEETWGRAKATDAKSGIALDRDSPTCSLCEWLKSGSGDVWPDFASAHRILIHNGRTKGSSSRNGLTSTPFSRAYTGQIRLSVDLSKGQINCVPGSGVRYKNSVKLNSNSISNSMSSPIPFARNPGIFPTGSNFLVAVFPNYCPLGRPPVKTFHALVAENLSRRLNNATSKIATRLFKPLIFNVQNPYLGGAARQINLEMERMYLIPSRFIR
ncbi:hypothetical protein C8R47DRAFT_1064452 [Mycena vitilis]|nr:hypothetical protein C8R47DRAFT_1064452 [Mycena vitilis]